VEVLAGVDKRDSSVEAQAGVDRSWYSVEFGSDNLSSTAYKTSTDDHLP
jgi:hypothetical protein